MNSLKKYSLLTTFLLSLSVPSTASALSLTDWIKSLSSGQQPKKEMTSNSSGRQPKKDMVARSSGQKPRK